MLKKISKSYDYDTNVQGVSPSFDLMLDKRTKRFLNSIKHLQNPVILEVGMGQGRFLKKIARLRPDARLYGVDISKLAIKVVKKENSLKGIFISADAQKLPFSEDFFNAVVIMDVLEHLNNPQKAILEAKRVLKAGGIFHFFVPCEGQPFTLNYFFEKTDFLNLKDFTKIYYGHIQHFSQADIKKLTSPYFSKISITYSVHWISQIFYFLVFYLPKKFIFLFGKDIQMKTRDAYRLEVKGGLADTSLVILKKLWLFFTFPVSIIYEIEAQLLKNFSFTAQGLHFTGQKKFRVSQK